MTITMARRGVALWAVCALLGGAPAAGAQQPKPIELDAATLAARTEAARSLVPLLEDVKQRATSRVTVAPGGAPPSPFTGTQTTLFAVTIGQKSTVVDPQVVQAMDRLMKWTPGDRTVPEAALFDEWFDALSKKATALNMRTNLVVCDASCVVQTMTRLDEFWGESPRQRAETRDQALLEALTEAVKAKR